jgi:signal transduction histidine kinase/CheY-like chemotaxis protein/PAS domain-containing protein/HPt (histidine-containing phosphotransfer) domain-containing protein
VKILVLGGRNLDEGAVRSLFGEADVDLVRYAAVSRGVRRLESHPAPLVVVAPDPADDTWARALRRVREEYGAKPALLVPPGGLESGDAEVTQRAMEGGAFDVFFLGESTPGDVARSLRHAACQNGLEVELAGERAKSRWIEETGRLGSWEMDGAGRVEWSDGVRRIFGDDGRLTEDFMSLRQFVLPEDREIFDQANKATFEQGWPLDFEYRILDGAGKVRHLHLHRRVEGGSGDTVTRAYGLVRDVTAEREFENFLFRRDAVIQVVGSFAGRFLREPDWESGISNALSALGKASDVTRVFLFRKASSRDDQAALTMTHEWAAPGVDPLLGRPEVEDKDFSQYAQWRASMLRRRVVVGNVRSFRSDEQSLFRLFGAKSVMVVPIFVGRHWWGFIGFSEHRKERDWQPVEIESLTMVADIFGSAILRRRMEEKLVAANSLAEEAKTMALDASRAKSRFLANMSHEIRTPISGILGLAEMIITTGLTSEQRKNMDMIRGAARSLLGIVNDVLDISKIEAERMELAPEDFDLRTLMETVVGPFMPQADQRGLLLRHRVDPDAPARVHGDPDRLAQILVNLLGNAMKFTERGLVELTVKVAVREPERTCLLFTVRDTGAGIPADKLEAVFDSFTQVDNSVRKKHQGTGLGLTIARELVEMMDGVIRVDSEPGEGTTFTFTAWFGMPRKAEAEAPKGASPMPRGLHLNLLLAEDNPLNQKFLTHFLTMFGHTVTVAGNGLEALEVLRRRGREIDLVLMDIQMPEMSGIEATRAIRESDGRAFDPAIPIIALTAYAMKDDRERMTRAGMDDYVSKPVDMKELSTAIARNMPATESPRRGVAVVGAEGSGPKDTAPKAKGFELDIPVLVERFDGNTEMLGEILELFLLESGPRLAALDAGIASGRPEELGPILHSITNLAGHVLAVEVMERAHSLESLCNKGRMAEALKGAAELRPRFAELIEAVRRGAETLSGGPALHFPV